MQTEALGENEFGTFLMKSQEQHLLLNDLCDVLLCFKEHGVLLIGQRIAILWNLLNFYGIILP